MAEVKEEYAEKPVPQNARLGFLKPAMVWAGFAHAYICIFIGSQIMGGLGAPIAYAAIISGQIFLFVYSGLIARRGAKLGLNFSMMCKAAFGKYGYIVPVQFTIENNSSCNYWNYHRRMCTYYNEGSK